MAKLTPTEESTQAALAAAVNEMAKPIMTSSAREQSEFSRDASLVVEDDTNERTVDMHARAIVLDEPQVTKTV